jgi:anti-sigma factor RsiW
MKPNVDCGRLDAYLAGELSAAQCAMFEAHVMDCDECRAEIEEQQWIDGMLCSRHCEAIEPAAARILATLSQQVRWRRRRRAALMASGLAAAVLAGVMVWGSADRTPVVLQLTEQRAEPVPAVQTDVLPAIFIAGDDAIAVPVASEYPDVTIVRVYAAYRPVTAAGAVPDLNADSATDVSPELTNGG